MYQIFTSKSLIAPAKWKPTAIIFQRLTDTEPFAPFTHFAQCIIPIVKFGLIHVPIVFSLYPFLMRGSI